MTVVGRLVTVLALMAVALPAIAQENDKTKPWTLTIGAFLPSDDPLCDVDADTGYSIGLFRTLQATEKDEWLGTLRYSQYDLADDSTVKLIHAMAEYRLTTKTFYVGPSAGFVLGHRDPGCNTFSFAYGMAAGLNMAPVTIEARVLRGMKNGESGIIISAGIRL